MTINPVDELRRTLVELSQELHAAKTLDADTRTLLKITLQEIEQKLAGSGAAATPSPNPSSAGSTDIPQPATAQLPVTDRLREFSLQFASEHPTLTGVVERTIDALGQLGI